MKQNGNLLLVKSLRTYFPVTGGIFSRVVGHVRAVDDLNIYIKEGETLGLVGESGCGKTTVGRSILRLEEPTSGEIYFRGENVMTARGRRLQKIRQDMQIIFQDPYSSLNPRKTIADVIGEALLYHRLVKNGRERDEAVKELLVKVGLSPNYINRYPHEFSGGQRQRIGIARAIAVKPWFIVCDEAVSALDVSIQAQVINLLIQLRQEMNLSYLFISHDLSVVKHISDRVAVMYLGKIVEEADCAEIFKNPMHPYTKALLSAVPIPDPMKRSQREILKGDVPSPLKPPSGCYFQTRCPKAMTRCREEEPEYYTVGEGHKCKCFLYDPAERDRKIAYNIGQKIREMREKRSISQAEFGRQVRVLHSDVTDWEAGKAVPSAIELFRILDFFVVNVDHFRREIDKEYYPESTFDQELLKEVTELKDRVLALATKVGLGEKVIELQQKRVDKSMGIEKPEEDVSPDEETVADEKIGAMQDDFEVLPDEDTMVDEDMRVNEETFVMREGKNSESKEESESKDDSLEN